MKVKVLRLRISHVKMKKLGMCMVIILALMLLIRSIIYRIHHFTTQTTQGTDHLIKRNPILQVVHLDLKGAPPKMSYLIHLLPRLSSIGVNGLLVEYEDMFPYDGELEKIPSKSHYSKEEVSRFLKYCAELNIEVIPLIQTFGHMEYILKKREFSDLREDPEDSRAICPSNDRSLKLIKEMIRQVLALHKFSKRIHIGCDEVSGLNMCPRCLEKRKSTMETFIDHVKQVAMHIQVSYNNSFTTLIWDDKLRWIPYDLVNGSNLHQYVEVVIWDYTPELEVDKYPFWNMYTSLFKKIWIAGAFKGADGETEILPWMKTRFMNHESLLKLLEKTSSNTVAGFISTGWSRYSHNLPLCELLPASIPSLFLTSLKVAATLDSSRRPNYLDDYKDILLCDLVERCPLRFCFGSEYRIEVFYDISFSRHCSFPESRLVVSTWELQQLQNQIKHLCDGLIKKYSWDCEDPLKSNTLQIQFLNINGINEHLKAESFDLIISQFHRVNISLSQEMEIFFNENTIKEWFKTHVEPFSWKLKSMNSTLHLITSNE
ncbi:hexosaminidase D-like [Planococcus citri]|uniref:hexosaminidase D-like n=1 Tax=Planococcus citri TaxID=170843 RepID=UPI0031F90DEB